MLKEAVTTPGYLGMGRDAQFTAMLQRSTRVLCQQNTY